MTDQHPITPPLGLVSQWLREQYGEAAAPGEATLHVATQAARWGADQELEACVEWVQTFADWGDLLRSDRRPNLPSRKRRALDALVQIENQCLSAELADEIRAALEELPDD